jgi:hypothetical protein
MARPSTFFDPDVGDVPLTVSALLAGLAGQGDPTKFINGAGTLSDPGNVGASLTTTTKTVNYAVLVGDTGTHFNNVGATVDIAFTLPASIPNLNYGFLVSAAHYVRINAQSGEQIAIDVTNGALGGYVRSNFPFSFLLLECHAAGQWIASSMLGTWDMDQ